MWVQWWKLSIWMDISHSILMTIWIQVHLERIKCIVDRPRYLSPILCMVHSTLLMGMLLLYTHISSFSMIFNIRATFGSIIRLGQCCRMCFEPLGIYPMIIPTISDHFRWFPMIFTEFPMFVRLYLTYRYIDGLSMHSLYYRILIRRVTDLLRLCFDFIYLWRYWYSDVSIIYSFGWLYYYYRFGLRSLRTIISIRSFWRHFDLSEVIFTYTYIALSFYKQ